MTPNRRSPFNPQIAIPQDHGAWVFLLSPLLIGLFAGKSFGWDSVLFVMMSFAIFFLRQPIVALVRSYSGRRSRAELPAAYFWAILYSLGLIASTIGLMLLEKWFVLLLLVPGIPVFSWHLYLVNRRRERKQAGVEILATGVLSLAAPAAFWLGKDAYDPAGWILWLLSWLQSSASIVHAFMRLEQRQQPSPPSHLQRWKIAWRALLYTSFNLSFSLGLTQLGMASKFIFLPFLLQWCETLWGSLKPATGWKPIHIGIRQLLVSILFTILFILIWR